MLDTIFFEFFWLLDVVLCVITSTDLGNYKIQTYVFCAYVNDIVTVSYCSKEQRFRVYLASE